MWVRISVLSRLRGRTRSARSTRRRPPCSQSSAAARRTAVSALSVQQLPINTSTPPPYGIIPRLLLAWIFAPKPSGIGPTSAAWTAAARPPSAAWRRGDRAGTRGDTVVGLGVDQVNRRFADAPSLPVVDGPRQGVELLDLEQALVDEIDGGSGDRYRFADFLWDQPHFRCSAHPAHGKVILGNILLPCARRRKSPSVNGGRKSAEDGSPQSPHGLRNKRTLSERSIACQETNGCRDPDAPKEPSRQSGHEHG